MPDSARARALADLAVTQAPLHRFPLVVATALSMLRCQWRDDSPPQDRPGTSATLARLEAVLEPDEIDQVVDLLAYGIAEGEEPEDLIDPDVLLHWPAAGAAIAAERAHPGLDLDRIREEIDDYAYRLCGGW